MGDRRENGSTSVSVDELSNGARSLIEEIRDEAKRAREAAVAQAEQTRQELKDAKVRSRLEFKEAREAFMRAVFRTTVAVIGSAFVLTFGLGAWYSKVNEDIAHRPTASVTRAMIDSVKAELVAVTAEQEIRTDGVISTLTQQTTLLESLHERLSRLEQAQDASRR